MFNGRKNKTGCDLFQDGCKLVFKSKSVVEEDAKRSRASVYNCMVQEVRGSNLGEVSKLFNFFI